MLQVFRSANALITGEEMELQFAAEGGNWYLNIKVWMVLPQYKELSLMAVFSVVSVPSQLCPPVCPWLCKLYEESPVEIHRLQGRVEPWLNRFSLTRTNKRKSHKTKMGS